MFLFEKPVNKKKVRNGVFAYLYKNGIIEIEGQEYLFHSMTSAIAKFRTDFPAYKKK